METQKKSAISPDDIVIQRDLIATVHQPVRLVTENGMLKALSQDYTVDGPKPKCDGND
jgi:hypothetical protein